MVDFPMRESRVLLRADFGGKVPIGLIREGICKHI